MIKASAIPIQAVIIAAILMLYTVISGCESDSTSPDTNDGTIISDGTEIGNPDDAPTYTAIAGVAQKGPFIKGGNVTLYKLDENFDRTEVHVSTQTYNDKGEFLVFLEEKSPFVEVQASCGN